jgi:hypothetical protein
VRQPGVLPHLGQVRGDDGQAGGQVLAELERIRAHGEGVDAEGDDADVEGTAVGRQVSVGLLAEQANVGQRAQRARIDVRLAEHDHGPRGSSTGDLDDEVEIQPLGDEAKEADDRPCQPRRVGRDGETRIERAREMRHVHAVRDEMRARVHPAAFGRQRLR